MSSSDDETEKTEEMEKKEGKSKKGTNVVVGGVKTGAGWFGRAAGYTLKKGVQGAKWSGKKAPVLSRGAFTVNKEFRTILKSLAYIFLLLLLLSSIGELFFSLFAYFYLSPYSHILKDFKLYFGLIKYMFFSFALLFVFTTLFSWLINTESEEEVDISQVRSSIVYYRLSFWASCVLVAFLIWLYVLSSNYFDDLYKELKSEMGNRITEYQKHTDIKADIDRMQWYYECCGAKNHEDWFGININIEDEGVNNSAGERKYKSVPFSCCRQDVDVCHFAFINESNRMTGDTIHKTGCVRRVIDHLFYFKYGVMWYRLVQFTILFLYMIVIDVLQQSYQSYEYDEDEATANFPTIWSIIYGGIWLCLYFFWFKRY